MKDLLVFVSAFCLLISCSPKYYTPNTQNVPLISEKGETNLTLAGNPNQVEFQGAYGVTNGFAVIADGGLFIPVNESNGNSGSGKFIEAGGGYFTPVGEYFVFELYGIAGIGSVENHLPSSTAPNTKGDISATIFRYGIQPNFGFKSKYFSAAISSRMVNLNYSNIKGDLIYASESQVAYLKENDSNFLIEPALTIKGGFEKIKLQIQMLQSVNLSNRGFSQDKASLTVGLSFNFREK